MLRTIFKRRTTFIPISASADTFEIEYDPEIVLPPSSGQPKPPGALQTTYEVWYLGSKQVPEAKSIATLIYTIKQMRKKPKRKIRVQFSFAHGVLSVKFSGRNTESILTLPFYAVALCVLDPDRGDSGCIAISSTMKMVHEVHIFQGVTHEQAKEVILGLGFAFSETGKGQTQVFADRPSLLQLDNQLSSNWRPPHTPPTPPSPPSRLPSPPSRLPFPPSQLPFPPSQLPFPPSRLPSPPSRLPFPPSQLPSLHPNTSTLDPQKIPPYNSAKALRPKLRQDKVAHRETSQSPVPSPLLPRPRTSQERAAEIQSSSRNKHRALEECIAFVRDNNEQLLTSFRDDKTPGFGFFSQAVRAVFSSNTQKLNELFKRRNVTPNTKDTRGNSLIHFATLQNDQKMVFFLIKQNADINQGGTNGITALHRATANHSAQMVKCLLRHNANVNAPDDNLRTPIFMLYARNTHREELTMSLVENGAEITCQDMNGLKPVHIWTDLQSYQQSLVTALCNGFMQSVPVGYNPGDILESTSVSVSDSLHTTTIPTRHNSILSIPRSDVGTVLMFHNEPLSEEARVAKLEKLRLSSSQFSLVSEDPIAGEARKLCENTAAMVKVGSKMVQHLEKHQQFKPLDLSNIDEVLRQVGVNEEFTMSPKFYSQLKNLQEEAKRREWERRKYGHSLKKSQRGRSREEEPRNERGVLGLEEVAPREFYLPDGTKLAQLKKSSSETMLHLINASKEVTQRHSQTMDDTALDAAERTEVKPGFMRAMRQLRKPIFSFFNSDSAASQPSQARGKSKNKRKVTPKGKPPNPRSGPFRAPKVEDLDSLRGDSLSSVPETGSENSEIFNKLVHELDPLGDRMGKISQLPLLDRSSLSDIFRTESFSRVRPNSIQDSQTPDRRVIPEGWLSSQEQAKDRIDTGRVRQLLSEDSRQRADSEPIKQRLGPQVEPPGGDVRREEAIRRRTGNYSDSTTSYRGNKNSLPSRPAQLSLGLQQSEFNSQSKSTVSGWGSTIIAYPLGLGESSSEPGASFIYKLLKLSANSECLSHLLAHMGLTKFFKRFLLFARASGVSEEMRINMGILVNNLFEVMHSESQRKAIEAGMLELVVQLVDSYWPLPGVSLSILNSVIDSQWPHDYLVTIAKSPIAPLLRCLSAGILDNDSGIESGRKSLGKIPPHRVQGGSFDTSSGSVFWSESSPLHRYPQPDHLPLSRSSRDSVDDSGALSFAYKRKLEETSEPLRSLLYPIAEPKTLILQLITYTSHITHMKLQLTTTHYLGLINEFLYDSNEEHIVLALNTIANVALRTSSHRILSEATLLRKLRSFLKQESMAAHHAARALIYMGEFDVGDVYLFDRVGLEKSNSIKYANMEDGTPFVKAGNLEALVEVLTNLPRKLWGGIQLMSPGPKRNNNGQLSFAKTKSRTIKVEPTEEKIFEFFLTTCRSFCEPIVLFRLLIHRFRDRFTYSIFDWNLVDLPASRLVYHPLPATAHIPKTQRLVLDVVQSWLRNFPEDFKKFDFMTEEVKRLLLHPLKKVKGPYYSYAQSIKNLLSQIQIKQRFKEPDPVVIRKPHHYHLYQICKKYVTEEMLPVKLDDTIFLSALQMYIEAVAEKKHRRLSGFSQDSTKLRNIVPSEYTKVKNIWKRIKEKQMDFSRQQFNERDSKHLYIEYCHALPGFGGTFFTIKEIILKRRYSPVQTRLLGISSSKIVVLDIQTKENLIEFPFHSLKSWFPNTNDKTIVLNFKKRRYLFLVQDSSLVTEISNVLHQCADEVNNVPTEESNPLYTSSEQSPHGKKMSSTLVHEDSPINRMAVDNAPKNSKKLSKFPQYLSTEEIESNSSTIASKSILPSADESSDYNSSSFEELLVLAAGVQSSPLSFMHNSEGIDLTPKLHQVFLQNGAARRKSRVPSGNLSAEPSPSGVKRLSAKLSPRRRTRDRLKTPTSPRASVSSRLSRVKYREKDGELTTEKDIMHWLSQTRTFDPSQQQTAAQEDVEVFGGVGLGRQIFCNCPPDPELSPTLRLDHICLEDVLQSPRELARQITLIDFDLLCRITPEDCLNYVIPDQRKSARMSYQEEAMKLFVDKGNLGKFAFRFAQVSSWVASSVLVYEVLEDRTEALRLFIQTAMECFHLKNYHAVHAIVVGALQSPPIKHLEKTWDGIAQNYKEFVYEMSELFETKGNYVKYRQCIQTTEVPAVPFFLLYLKDLTYIVNANPDFLKGGLINFDKRRLIYGRLEEIQYFQSHKYQLKWVPEIRNYLCKARFVAQGKLVHVAHELEGRDGRSGGSQGSLNSETSSGRELANFYGTISRNITRRGFFYKK